MMGLSYWDSITDKTKISETLYEERLYFIPKSVFLLFKETEDYLKSIHFLSLLNKNVLCK